MWLKSKISGNVNIRQLKQTAIANKTNFNEYALPFTLVSGFENMLTNRGFNPI